MCPWSSLYLTGYFTAGFNYDFETLRTDRPPNEVNKAFQALFQSPLPQGIWSLLRRFFPILAEAFVRNEVDPSFTPKFLTFELQPTERDKTASHALDVMRRFGMQLIKEKKQQIMSGKASLSVERKDVQGRDILTLLIKSNMASDVPESQRLTDEEVLARTFPLNRILNCAHKRHDSNRGPDVPGCRPRNNRHGNRLAPL